MRKISHRFAKAKTVAGSSLLLKLYTMKLWKHEEDAIGKGRRDISTR